MPDQDKTPEQDTNQTPQEHELEHAHEHAAHEGGVQCACCNDATPTEDEYAMVEADPAGRSLSRALALSFTILRVIMVLILLFLVFESAKYLDQSSVGVKQRFGKFVRNADGTLRLYQPGELVFLWPAPIETLIEVPTQKDQTLELRYDFWPGSTGMPNVDENAELPASDMLDPSKDAYTLTGDSNIIHSRWRIQYRIEDPERWLLAVAAMPRPVDDRLPTALREKAEELKARDILRRIANSVILARLGGASVDDLLGEKNSDIFNAIIADISSAMADDAGRPRWGIRVISVSNERILPPGKVRGAFNAVSTALSARKTREEAARGDARMLINKAESEAANIVNAAETYRTAVVAGARADALRLQALLDEFPNDPAGLHVYLQQYRQDVLMEALANTDRYVLRPGQAWFMTGPLPEQFLGKGKKDK